MCLGRLKKEGQVRQAAQVRSARSVSLLGHRSERERRLSFTTDLAMSASRLMHALEHGRPVSERDVEVEQEGLGC